MTALLELPAIRERVFPISVELYHRLPEGLRTELLRGTIIKKGWKSPLQIFMAHRLHQILAAQIASDCTVFLEGALTTEDSEPEPDLCVVRGEIDRFRSIHPSTAELVIEVAVTSVEIDRVKAFIYAEAGVKEYWIVCPDEKRVEVFLLPTRQGYAESHVVEANEILASTALPGVQMSLMSLFA